MLGWIGKAWIRLRCEYLPKGTIIGDTNTANELSSLRVAVPTSLMVLLRIFAYSKSTAST